ncbi:hypothetical protein AAMO2058_001730800 [Amorphochlora amoebiformis]
MQGRYLQYLYIKRFCREWRSLNMSFFTTVAFALSVTLPCVTPAVQASRLDPSNLTIVLEGVLISDECFSTRVQARSAIREYSAWIQSVARNETIRLSNENSTSIDPSPPYPCPSPQLDAVWRRHLIESEMYMEAMKDIFGPFHYFHRASLSDIPPFEPLRNPVGFTTLIPEYQNDLEPWDSTSEGKLGKIAQISIPLEIAKGCRRGRFENIPNDKVDAKASDKILQLYHNMHVVSSKGNTIPSIEIDTVWHAHITESYVYWQYCLKEFGYFKHHKVGHTEEELETLPSLNPLPTPDSFQASNSLYELILGESIDPELWVHMGTSRGHGHSPHGHNPHGHYPHSYAPINNVERSLTQSGHMIGQRPADANTCECRVCDCSAWYCPAPCSTVTGFSFVFIGLIWSTFIGTPWARYEGYDASFCSFSSSGKLEMFPHEYQASPCNGYPLSSESRKYESQEDSYLCGSIQPSCGGKIQDLNSAMEAALWASVVLPVAFFVSIISLGCVVCRCAGNCCPKRSPWMTPSVCIRIGTIGSVSAIVLAIVALVIYQRNFPSLCSDIQFFATSCTETRGSGFVFACLGTIFAGVGAFFLVYQKPRYFQTTLEIIPETNAGPEVEKQVSIPDWENIDVKNPNPGVYLPAPPGGPPPPGFEPGPGIPGNFEAKKPIHASTAVMQCGSCHCQLAIPPVGNQVKCGNCGAILAVPGR